MSTFHRHSCKRGILPGINGHRTYNLTKTGLCEKIPWHVANLTQSDASARYDESNLFVRSVQNSAARFSHLASFLSFSTYFILWTLFDAWTMTRTFQRKLWTIVFLMLSAAVMKEAVLDGCSWKVDMDVSLVYPWVANIFVFPLYSTGSWTFSCF